MQNIKYINIFHIYGGFFKKTGYLNNICKGSIKKKKSKKKIYIFKKGQIKKTQPIILKKSFLDFSLNIIHFKKNYGFLLNKYGSPADVKFIRYCSKNIKYIKIKKLFQKNL